MADRSQITKIRRDQLLDAVKKVGVPEAVRRVKSVVQETTKKDGWHVGREYWRNGDVVGWIGLCFDPETLEETGYYAQVIDPVRFLVKNVSRAEAVSAVEEAINAK